MGGGVVIPGYELGPELGRGGMGTVYEARETVTGHRVAIKLIPATGAAVRASFIQESRTARATRHPNLLPVYAAGETDGWFYLVLELLKTDTLQDHLDSGGLEPALATRLVAETAQAAHSLHLQRLIHRDIKPANVLLKGDGGPEECHAVLADFGIAQPLADERSTGGLGGDSSWLMTEDDPAPAPEMTRGTYAYMAPEQWRGEGDHRVDVYALGCLLYAALTGLRPYHDRRSLPQLLHAVVIEDEPLRPSAVDPAIPPDLDAVVARATARDPGDRYPDAAHLAAALTGARPTVATPRRAGPDATNPIPPLRGRRGSRRRLVVVAAAACVLSAGAATAWLLIPTPPDPQVSTVCAQDLTLRSRPGTNATALETIFHGQRLTVLTTANAGVWTEVRFRNRTGWVLSQWIRKRC
jgi:serine/threonine protein kinase